MQPRHECGICDGRLEFIHADHGYPSWCCTDCGEWHTSQDCCVNPWVNVGDRIRLTLMENDPDPMPIGSTGTVTGFTSSMDQSVPEHFDQIYVEWDNGRSLILAPTVDRFELDNMYVVNEEEELLI